MQGSLCKLSLYIDNNSYLPCSVKLQFICNIAVKCDCVPSFASVSAKWNTLMEPLIITIQPREPGSQEIHLSESSKWHHMKRSRYSSRLIWLFYWESIRAQTPSVWSYKPAERTGAKQEGLEGTGLRKKHCFMSANWTRTRNAAWAVISGAGVQHWSM